MIYQLTLTALGHLIFKGNERYASFVISANSEIEAREIAAKQDQIGGGSIWNDKSMSNCQKLDLNKRIISATFLTKSNL